MPPSLGKLTNLEWLDLSSNKLIGEIPIQLADLTSLEVLNLSENYLFGSHVTGSFKPIRKLSFWTDTSR